MDSTNSSLKRYLFFYRGLNITKCGGLLAVILNAQHHAVLLSGPNS